jgi:recombination protein RecR
MADLPHTIQNLIAQFDKLPGIGPKTAEKLAFFLLKQSEESLTEFAQSIFKAKENLTICSLCHNLTENNPCSICQDQNRDKKAICVVADIQDFLAIEKTGSFKGLYHILNGNLNPLEGITPDRLNIDSLIERIKNNNIKEIILGFNPDVEGETTMLYLSKLLKDFQIKITRLARGLPTGSDIEYTDEITLTNALQDRKEI